MLPLNEMLKRLGRTFYEVTHCDNGSPEVGSDLFELTPHSLSHEGSTLNKLIVTTNVGSLITNPLI